MWNIYSRGTGGLNNFMIKEEVVMKEKTGNHLVTFRPGEVIGMHNEREVVLEDICNRLGGFGFKIFDPYMVYSNLADNGFLVRVEELSSYGYWMVSFFYPNGKDENETRRIIINYILNEAKNDPKLLTNGYAVVSDNNGNLNLSALRRARKNS